MPFTYFLGEICITALKRDNIWYSKNVKNENNQPKQESEIWKRVVFIIHKLFYKVLHTIQKKKKKTEITVFGGV